MATLIERAAALFGELDALPDDERIETLNALRRELHAHSPMGAHPCDCILWVRPEQVQANDYNPNVVAAPEMRLLNKSVEADGYTMPIVTWETGVETYEVVDGFHRHLVGQQNKRVKASTCGRLPISVIRPTAERSDRIAATIRHNRARGKHTVDGMAEIVLDLARRNWSDSKISAELGMEADEVLRLRQITGLAEMFADEEFSEAWEVDVA